MAKSVMPDLKRLLLFFERDIAIGCSIESMSRGKKYCEVKKIHVVNKTSCKNDLIVFDKVTVGLCTYEMNRVFGCHKSGREHIAFEARDIQDILKKDNFDLMWKLNKKFDSSSPCDIALVTSYGCNRPRNGRGKGCV
jgi:hypothetical protein